MRGDSKRAPEVASMAESPLPRESLRVRALLYEPGRRAEIECELGTPFSTSRSELPLVSGSNLSADGQSQSRTFIASH